MRHLGTIFTETKTWSFLALAAVAVVVLPAVFIMAGLLHPATENWGHIRDYLLADYILTTLLVFAGTGLLSTLIGVSLAYFVTVFAFPGRRFFRWALILPLSIPAYISAYTYSGMLSFTGVATQVLSHLLGRLVLIDIMSLPGAILIFTFALYPYVYMISLAFFAKYTASLIESARLLGRGFTAIFFQVILPVSRGVIASGCALVLMEVANDYGVVSYFGVNTFSVAIFKAWFGMGDVRSAVRLAAFLMVFTLLFIGLEKLLRGQKSFSIAGTKPRALRPVKLPPAKGLGVSLFASLVLGIGFLIPCAQLIAWAFLTYEEVLNPSFLGAALNTVLAAAAVSLAIVFLSVVIVNNTRVNPTALSRAAAKTAALGYSTPGAVLAVGVLMLFVILDGFTQALWQYSLLTSLAMLYFAYTVRFLAVGLGAVENGFEKVGRTYFEASRTLGQGVTGTLLRVDLPMIRPALVGAFMLVFVDMVKELPLTLILRPFNFTTLASKVYEYAHDERIHHSAPAALIIMAVCTVSVYLMAKADRE